MYRGIFMSILSVIKDFTYDILGIKDDTQVKSATTKNENINTPIISYEIKEGNVDKFEPQTTAAPNKQENTNIGQIKQTIENKCLANGIDYVGLLKNIGEVAGITKAQFDALSKDEQKEILNIVSAAIDKSIEQKMKYGISSNVNESEVIKSDAQNIYKAMQSGAIATAKELYDEIGDVNKEIGKNFKNLSILKQRAKLESYRTEKKQEFEEYLQAQLKNVPEEKRGEIEKKLRSKQKFVERGRFNDVLRTQSSETALNSIVLLSSNDIDYGAETIMSTRINKAEKTRTADMANFEFFEGLAKSFYSFDEQLDGNSVKNYTVTMTSNMSKNALSQYQEDYVEVRSKIENGEVDAPYFSQEVLSNTSIGIGVGANLNVNMTTAEKAEFLNKWENDAKQFNDYEYVVSQTNSTIEEYLEKYPERSNEIKVILNKKEELNNHESIEDKFVEELLYKNTSATLQNISSEISIPSSNEKKVKENDTKEQIVTNPILKNINANQIEIKKSLTKIGVNESIKTFGIKNTINTILEDKSLNHLRPQLIPVIKSLDLNSLKEICKDCSDSTFVFICKIVNPDFIQELQDNRTSLCYNAKKQVENMEKNVA